MSQIRTFFQNSRENNANWLLVTMKNNMHIFLFLLLITQHHQNIKVKKILVNAYLYIYMKIVTLGHFYYLIIFTELNQYLIFVPHFLLNHSRLHLVSQFNINKKSGAKIKKVSSLHIFSYIYLPTTFIQGVIVLFLESSC